MKKRSFWDKADNYVKHVVLAFVLSGLFGLQLFMWMAIDVTFSETPPGAWFAILNVGGFAMFVKELSEKVTDQWRVYKRVGMNAFIEALRQVFGIDKYSDPADRELELSRDPLWDWLIPYLSLTTLGLVL